MLIGLVRESVMQCFCQTCRAPMPVMAGRTGQIPITKIKAKPRTHQPKRVQFVTTEVRCQEKKRGGLRYEVILGEGEVKATPPKKQVTPKNSMTVQEIEDKLKAAEERRLQIESNKIAALSVKMHKIEEASKKKDEHTTQFISATRDALEQKMENYCEKREAYITDLKTKLKDHIENVEKTRLSLDQQTSEIKTQIEEKLKTASAQRDENMKKMVERLKEHEEKVNLVRSSNAEKFHQLEVAVQEKLDHAQNRRAQLEHEQREKLRSYNNRPLEIKQNVEQIQEILHSKKASELESKLSLAEQNREKEMQKKLEVLKQKEKRAEIVRQNKANLLAAKESVTPSSG